MIQNTLTSLSQSPWQSDNGKSEPSCIGGNCPETGGLVSPESSAVGASGIIAGVEDGEVS